MTKVTTKKKLAVLGNGFLAGIIVETYNKGLLEEYELTGILGRTKEKTEALAEKICTDIEKIDEAADFFAVITNEVGSDGEMYEKETLEYIRLLGLVNCRLAKMASEVVEVVYGIPVMKKGAEV